MRRSMALAATTIAVAGITFAGVAPASAAPAGSAAATRVNCQRYIDEARRHSELSRDYVARANAEAAAAHPNKTKVAKYKELALEEARYADKMAAEYKKCRG
ncbi:hypothetical protein [Streptomyces sp. NPDC101150]|uniref:hypothetical protein n=1 Tax=Streptomyces sp. NPDC101150 TaxID=3366114 RepID=UPI00381EE105